MSRAERPWLSRAASDDATRIVLDDVVREGQ